MKIDSHHFFLFFRWMLFAACNYNNAMKHQHYIIDDYARATNCIIRMEALNFFCIQMSNSNWMIVIPIIFIIWFKFDLNIINLYEDIVIINRSRCITHYDALWWLSISLIYCIYLPLLLSLSSSRIRFLFQSLRRPLQWPLKTIGSVAKHIYCI